VAVGTTIGPSQSITLSIVVAWHFPDRDFYGAILGNYYANLWDNSFEVAAELAAQGRLSKVVRDINAHHAVIAHPRNPTPVWLKDMLVNQWSHFHMLMWYRDGRLREWEAWSCIDVDSVHNDYQRHLPYLWAFPEFEKSKMEAWSTFAQHPDGYIIESLVGFGARVMDQPAGRLMGDTTSLYLLELYEIMRNSGNVSYVASKWKSATRAVEWMIKNAGVGPGSFGLPQRLWNTYDHFGFETHKTNAYNAHVYLTSLEAVRRMAVALNDTWVQTWAEEASLQGKEQLLNPITQGGVLWNDTLKYFVAHSNTTTQIFTDTLYGQMLSHHHFGHFTIGEDYLDSHLAYEWERNQDKYGMRVLNDPVQEDSIWMNGPPTWTYLQLQRGQLSDAAAYEPFKRMSENFRTRLKDLWNLRALTHTETAGTPLEHGNPREQGHYAFMMTDLYLLPLLSGQATNLHKGVLSLKPRFQPPYVLPVLLMNCEATLEATLNSNGIMYRLAVAFGEVSIPAGGLVVNDVPYKGAVALKAGEAIAWQV